MLGSIANSFSNCFKIPELKSRIIFTLVVLAICRLEAVVRIPGLNGGGLAAFWEKHATSGGGVLGMFRPFSRGAPRQLAPRAFWPLALIQPPLLLPLSPAGVPPFWQIVPG